MASSPSFYAKLALRVFFAFCQVIEYEVKLLK